MQAISIRGGTVTPEQKAALLYAAMYPDWIAPALLVNAFPGWRVLAHDSWGAMGFTLFPPGEPAGSEITVGVATRVRLAGGVVKGASLAGRLTKLLPAPKR